MKEHGTCPACGTSWEGGLVWDHFFEETKSEEEATRIAEMYGATRTEGRWGRQVGLYDMMKDRTVGYQCPDCGHVEGRTV
jgi:hypothetical protein